MRHTKFYLLLVGVGIIGIILGSFIYSRTKAQIYKDTVALPTTFITHPALDNLYAQIDGTVVAKTPDSLRVTKDGVTVDMYIEDKNGITYFYKHAQKGDEIVSFDDVKEGDHVQGGINIIVNSRGIGSGTHNKLGSIIAHAIYINP